MPKPGFGKLFTGGRLQSPNYNLVVAGLSLRFMRNLKVAATFAQR